jgi:hypothetical protein
LVLADHAAIYLSNRPCNIGRAALSKNNNALLYMVLHSMGFILHRTVTRTDGGLLPRRFTLAGLPVYCHSCVSRNPILLFLCQIPAFSGMTTRVISRQPGGLISVTLSVARGLPPHTPGCFTSRGILPLSVRTFLSVCTPRLLVLSRLIGVYPCFNFLSIARFASLSAFLFFDLSIYETV